MVNGPLIRPYFLGGGGIGGVGTLRFPWHVGRMLTPATKQPQQFDGQGSIIRSPEENTKLGYLDSRKPTAKVP